MSPQKVYELKKDDAGKWQWSFVADGARCRFVVTPDPFKATPAPRGWTLK